MRPIRLDMDGFTVFREPTTVDFTDIDFFALVGPTGSGKSTILDAITFALYGTVPRWGNRSAIANALAPSAAEARVRLVFESAGQRYVISRVVRRDAKGAVTTKHAGLEAITSAEDGELGEVLAGTPAEVDTAILDVFGRIREKANGLATAADAQLAAIDQHLARMTDADDAALEKATERVAVVRALGGAVDQVLPKLT